MQDGLFFRVLRRFNMILVAVLGILIIAAIGYQTWKTHSQRHYLSHSFLSAISKVDRLAAKNTGSVDPESFGTTETYYGPNTNTILVKNEFDTPPVGNHGFEGYQSKHAVNLMVLDQKTGSGTWLFPSSKQIIVSRDALYVGAATQRTDAASDLREAYGMVMCVSGFDKSGKAIAPNGCPALYMWTKGMGAAKKLLDIDDLISMGQYGADRYIVVYKSGKTVRSITYALPGFERLSDQLLPDAPK